MSSMIEQLGFNPGLALGDPWKVQVSMLPLRREFPDDEKNAKAKERIAAGQQSAVREAKRLAERNRKKVLPLFKGKAELKASQIAEKTGLCDETARVILNEMANAGLLEKRREGNTYWFRAVEK